MNWKGFLRKKSLRPEEWGLLSRFLPWRDWGKPQEITVRTVFWPTRDASSSRTLGKTIIAPQTSAVSLFLHAAFCSSNISSSAFWVYQNPIWQQLKASLLHGSLWSNLLVDRQTCVAWEPCFFGVSENGSCWCQWRWRHGEVRFVTRGTNELTNELPRIELGKWIIFPLDAGWYHGSVTGDIYTLLKQTKLSYE